eukprot:6211799-Pleurochrysis_carterae.AAC.4
MFKGGDAKKVSGAAGLAKLHDLVIDALPVELSAASEANIWKHTGPPNKLKFDKFGRYYKSKFLSAFVSSDYEIYLFRAYYNYGNGEMFENFGPNSPTPCSGDDYKTVRASTHTALPYQPYPSCSAPRLVLAAQAPRVGHGCICSSTCETYVVGRWKIGSMPVVLRVADPNLCGKHPYVHRHCLYLPNPVRVGEGIHWVYAASRLFPANFFLSTCAYSL